jgi:uncharacterized membrane protein required for colicin V production
MSSYIDIGIFIIILIFLFIGMVKGFFKSVLQLVGTVVSLVIAFALGQTVLNELLKIEFFHNLALGESGFSLYSAIRGWLPASFADIQVGANADVVNDALSGDLNKGLAGVLSQLVSGLQPGATGDLLTVCSTMIATGVAFAIVTTALFIVLRIIIAVLNAIINKIRQNKTVRGLDRLFGMLVGAVKGVVAVGIILVLSSFVINVPFLSSYKTALEESAVGKPMYDTFTTWTANWLPFDEWFKNFSGIKTHEPTEEETALAAEIDLFADGKTFGSDGAYAQSTFTAEAYDDAVQANIAKLRTLTDALKNAAETGEYTEGAELTALKTEMTGIINGSARTFTDTADGYNANPHTKNIDEVKAALNALFEDVANKIAAPLGYDSLGHKLPA